MLSHITLRKHLNIQKSQRSQTNGLGEYTKTTLFDELDDSRTFAFIVEGKSVWIDKDLLAKESPVFSIMLLDERFIDSKEQMKELSLKKHSEMVEFFACLFSYPKPKWISSENFKRNVELADEYDVQKMLDLCLKLVTPVPYVLPDIGCLLKDDVLQTCFKYEKFHSAVVELIPHIAAQEMAAGRVGFFFHFPECVMKALLDSCANATKAWHDLNYSGNRTESRCSTLNCRSRSIEPFWYCAKCCSKFCRSCVKQYASVQTCDCNHVKCGYKKTGVCLYACEYWAFSAAQLVDDLKEFSLRN